MVIDVSCATFEADNGDFEILQRENRSVAGASAGKVFTDIPVSIETGILRLDELEPNTVGTDGTFNTGLLLESALELGLTLHWRLSERSNLSAKESALRGTVVSGINVWSATVS